MFRKLQNWFRPRDKGIGHRSIFIRAWETITAAKFRRKIGSNFLKLLEFKRPQWASQLANKALTPPTTTLTWKDYVNPMYWIVWTFSFVGRWIITRPYLSIGPALPALIILAVLVLLGGRLMFGVGSWRALSYRQKLTEAMRNEDYDVANICLTNLIKRSPDNESYRFTKALVDDKRGRKDMAAQTMLRLVDENEDPAAASWLIQENFQLDGMPTWNKADHDQFRKLMSLALTTAKGQDEVILRTNFANYFIAVKAPGEALRNLTEVASRNRALTLITAMLSAQIGNKSDSRLWADQARQYYQEALRSKPDDKNARLNLARAFILLEEEKQATLLLQEGLSLTGDPDFRKAGAEAMVAWADRLKQTSTRENDGLIQRLDLIMKALKLGSDNPIVTERAVQIILECRDNQSDQVLTMRKALISGVSPEAIHFVEGTIALLDGDLENAMTKLSIASEHSNQNMPGVLNNLAVALYKQENPRLEEALRFSNAAIEQLPGYPALLETRGQILLRMEQFKPAIADLENALKDPAIASQAHDGLARAYRAIGQTELAAQHQYMADRLGFKPDVTSADQ